MSKLKASPYSLAALNSGWVFTPAFSKLTRMGDLIATEPSSEAVNGSAKVRALRRPSTVIILGWWNANAMQLRHYTQLYSDLGYDTLTHISPTFQYPSWKSLVRRHVGLLQSLQSYRQEMPESNVVIHALSNNGAFTAAVLHRLSIINQTTQWAGLASRDLMQGLIPKNLTEFPIERMVFDSCPAPLNAEMLTHATLEATERGLNHWSKDTLQASWNAFLSSSRVVSILDGLLYPSMDVLIPQRALVVGSIGDLVVPWQQVQEWTKQVRTRGAQIVEHEFEDSGHVGHLRKHPQQYKQVIAAFLHASETPRDVWKEGRVGSSQ